MNHQARAQSDQYLYFSVKYNIIAKLAIAKISIFFIVSVASLSNLVIMINVPKFRTVVSYSKKSRQTAQTQLRLLLQSYSDMCFVKTSPENQHFILSTVKPVLSGLSKRRPKIGFQYGLLLMAGQKYCRMLQREHSAILSTFRLSFSYQLS